MNVSLTAEDVRWAYRLLLGREAESEEIVEAHRLAHATRASLTRAFLESDEFTQRELLRIGPSPDVVSRVGELLRRIGPPPNDRPGSTGAPRSTDRWIDAAGVVTRTRWRARWSERAGLSHRAGDLPPNAGMAEWIPLLESILEGHAAGQESFCVVELGAGYGPWVARAGVLWRRVAPGRGLHLLAVEGEPGHFEFLRQHLTDNGLTGPTVRALAGAVVAVDGPVQFEVAADPAKEWATRVVAAGPADSGLPGARVSVPGHSLRTLAADLPPIDLLHIDIQGDEFDVLAAAPDVVAERVHRLCIGTHGREIEGRLLDLLPGLGFRLRLEGACKYGLGGRRPSLIEDGFQYWVRE